MLSHQENENLKFFNQICVGSMLTTDLEDVEVLRKKLCFKSTFSGKGST